MNAKKQKVESQIDKFRDMARKLECDESEKAFDEKLKRVAKEKPEDKSSS